MAFAVALALAACGEALPSAATGQAELPTPTATASPTHTPTPTWTPIPTAAPTPTPTATHTPTPTLIPATAPDADQQTLPSPGDIETTMDCGRPMANSYDIASVAKAPHFHWIYDIRVSGEDYHMKVTMLEQDGAVNEVMGVDGVNYVYGEGQWESLDRYFSLPQFHSPHPIESEFVVCPNLEIGSLSLVGSDLLNGQEVDHFRIGEELNLKPITDPGDVLSETDVVNRIWDIWVDANGQLVQTTLIADYAETPDHPAIRVDIQSTISGVGEPNVITAPTLPTPTPTAASAQ